MAVAAAARAVCVSWAMLQTMVLVGKKRRRSAVENPALGLYSMIEYNAPSDAPSDSS
jgi:hypothetical protein